MMKQYTFLLFPIVVILICQLTVNAAQDCSKLKGVAQQQCQADERAFIDSIRQRLHQNQALQGQMAEQLDQSNRHLDNVIQIYDDGIKKLHH